MPDRETWGFINSFAPWFSALGTFCAVLVSLYLAQRASRHSVRVSCAIVRAVPTGQSFGDGADFFQIRVVNRGFREAVISGIMWKQRGWHGQTYVVFPPADPYSTQLPAKLQYGDSAHFFFPTETFPRLAKELLKTLKMAGPSSPRLRMLRAGVYASTGEEFLSPLDERIRKWLVEQARSASA